MKICYTVGLILFDGHVNILKIYEKCVFITELNYFLVEITILHIAHLVPNLFCVRYKLYSIQYSTLFRTCSVSGIRFTYSKAHCSKLLLCHVKQKKFRNSSCSRYTVAHCFETRSVPGIKHFVLKLVLFQV